MQNVSLTRTPQENGVCGRWLVFKPRHGRNCVDTNYTGEPSKLHKTKQISAERGQWKINYSRQRCVAIKLSRAVTAEHSYENFGFNPFWCRVICCFYQAFSHYWTARIIAVACSLSMKASYMVDMTPWTINLHRNSVLAGGFRSFMPFNQNQAVRSHASGAVQTAPRRVDYISKKNNFILAIFAESPWIGRTKRPWIT